METNRNSHFDGFDKVMSKITSLDELLKWIGSYPPELDSLVKFLKQEDDRGDKAHISIAVQLIYQLLIRSRCTDLQTCIRELVHLLHSKDLDNVTRANIIVCLQLYVQKFDDMELLRQLWDRISNEHQISETSIQIVVHLVDDFMRLIENFHCDAAFKRIIETLLTSQLPTERKTGYYLLRKYVSGEELRSPHAQLPSHPQWLSSIVVLEALEENQPHLILPSLQLMKTLPLTGDTFWMTLLKILYKKVLTHNNSQIIEWAVDYFMGHFSSSYVHSLSLLPDLLGCLNNTRLYNYEGHFLSLENASLFLRGELNGFIDEMPKINWKSVPLHFWLKQLVNIHTRVPVVSRQTVLALASRIRNLQNVSIRNVARRHFSYVLRASIKQMPFADYCMLIEAMYNVNDAFPHIEQFVQKASESSPQERSALTGRLFQILSNKFCANEESGTERVWNVHDQKRWLPEFKRFSRMSFLLYLYGVKAEKLDDNATYLDVVDELCTAFDDLNINCSSFLREKALEYYVKWFWILDFSELPFKELIKKANPAVFWEVLQKFPDNTGLEPLQIPIFIQYLKPLVAAHKNDTHIFDILDLLYRICLLRSVDGDIAKQLFEIAISVPMYKLHCLWHKPLNFVIDYPDGLVAGDMTSGECRIEKIYNMRVNQLWCPQYQARFYNLEYCTANRTVFAQQLLDFNNRISKQKPRYFENSKEHLQKMRIASVVLQAVYKTEFYSPDMWLPILEQNNQLNVTYMYEIAIAHNSMNIDSIMEKAREIASYTSSVQISVISILHLYCTLFPKYESKEHWNEIFKLLLPLTMGANFQVRLFSQLVLYEIMPEHKNEDGIVMSPVKEALENTIGKEHIGQFIKNDVRLQLHKLVLIERFSISKVIAYVTNAPIDEYDWTDASLSRFDDLRQSYMKRHNAVKEVCDNGKPKAEAEHPQMMDVTNIQRKMNPPKELLSQSNLVTYPESEDHIQMFVVATLIDKLPNLGGIARTCEVFGIKNLVLSSKAYTQRDDFKNLSMSAENMLNIIEVKSGALIEFLMQKRLEGFKIVGAEQTVNSKSFVDFEFPKRCVLLMGHEKEGLPANLIGLLDYAVEIPQFGMVRSLNVHVTGALFMWEYCKQHMTAKK